MVVLTINCHKQQPLWLYNLKQLVQVAKDLDDHFLLGKRGAWVISVCAVVNDAVHVQVQVVYERSFANIGWLVEQGVSFAQPSVELGDACGNTRQLSQVSK